MLPLRAFSGLIDMQILLEELSANHSLAVGPGLRSMNQVQTVFPMFGGALDFLDGYGCWCYFDQDVGKGQGIPMNEIDSWCRTLHHGYSCARIDDANNNLCHQPWEEMYNHIDLSKFVSAPYDGVDIECDTLNPGNDCAARACTVESYFILHLVKYTLIPVGDPNSFDQSVQHANGWDPTAHCFPVGADTSPMECCGTYPVRFPYRTKNGDRACCGSVTYDATLHNCCAGDH